MQKKKKQDMQYNYNIQFRCPENDLKFYKLCFEIYQMAVNQMCITLQSCLAKTFLYLKCTINCVLIMEILYIVTDLEK